MPRLPPKGKVRRFTEFFDGAESSSRVERIIARVEAGEQGSDTQFIVTSLAGGKARTLYERIYCRRGTAENHIKASKTHLAADRTSCPRATANQFRLFLHAGAYWLMWGLRAMMPKRSLWRIAQFDTLRLRLIKIAARVSAFEDPDPAALAERLPRSDDPAGGSWPHSAPCHLIDGAHTPPDPSPCPSTCKPAALTAKQNAWRW